MQDERQYFWIDKIRPNNKAVFEFAGLPQDDSDDVEINELFQFEIFSFDAL